MHEGRILGAFGAILAVASLAAPWTLVTWADGNGIRSYGQTPAYIWEGRWATFDSPIGYPTPRPDLYADGLTYMFLGIFVLLVGSIVAFVSRLGGIVMLGGATVATIGVISAAGPYVYPSEVLTIAPGWGFLVAWMGVAIAVGGYFKKDSPDEISLGNLDESRLARSHAGHR